VVQGLWKSLDPSRCRYCISSEFVQSHKCYPKRADTPTLLAKLTRQCIAELCKPRDEIYVISRVNRTNQETVLASIDRLAHLAIINPPIRIRSPLRTSTTDTVRRSLKAPPKPYDATPRRHQYSRHQAKRHGLTIRG
jgi:hypothetical protein